MAETSKQGPTHTPGGLELAKLEAAHFYEGKVSEGDILWLADMKNLLPVNWSTGGALLGILINQTANSIINLHLARQSGQFDFPAAVG